MISSMVGGQHSDGSLGLAGQTLLEYLHHETDAMWSLATTPLGVAFPVVNGDGSGLGYLCMLYDGDSGRYEKLGEAVATSLGLIYDAAEKTPARSRSDHRVVGLRRSHRRRSHRGVLPADRRAAVGSGRRDRGARPHADRRRRARSRAVPRLVPQRGRDARVCSTGCSSRRCSSSATTCTGCPISARPSTSSSPACPSTV